MKCAVGVTKLLHEDGNTQLAVTASCSHGFAENAPLVKICKGIGYCLLHKC